MADPYHHAVSSQKKFGGEVEDYIWIHQWFDATKQYYADPRHRALRHHAEGIQEAIDTLGDAVGCVLNSDGREIPIRWIGEQHVMEDCGFIPTVKDWLRNMSLEQWMDKPMKISRENDG